MNYVNTVYEISKSFMDDSLYVTIDHDEMENVAEQMLENEPPKFKMPEVQNVQKGILLELVAASVNYCYWYGKSNVRPLQANSTKMYNLLLQAFVNYGTHTKFRDCITQFSILLSQNRFPLIEHRIKHLEELVHKDAELFSISILTDYKNDKLDLNNLMSKLISYYPGFASDIFLKRASLFFIQLFRRFGWFSNDLHSLHVPADYQIPKMLEYFGCICYEDSLKHAIKYSTLLSSGSIIECEIRAATILSIKRLCEITEWNVAEVDAFFFLQRHKVTDPFHLTITTDY